MYSTIGNKLYTLIDGIKGTANIQAVYNYPKKSSEGGFPYVTITPADSQDLIEDTQYNRLSVSFVITAYIQNQDISTEEPKLRSVVDAILVALRDDRALTGSALQSSFDITWGYADDEQALRVAQITASYNALVVYDT